MIGGSWTHKLARPLVRPLIGTPVRPNHITTVRLLSGLVACALFARGGHAALVWGGVIWLVSAFLDRADGELARLGDLKSTWGHLYDYHTDNAVNALFFLAVGVGSRGTWLGGWAWPLGVVACVALQLCNMFSEWLERRGPPDTRAYSGRWGFDPDDALFLMAPFAWLGWLPAILVGAAGGTTIMAAITGARLLRARKDG